jgi:osmoprotectant transport system substrate-binding protein
MRRCLLAGAVVLACSPREAVVVGSKNFTESVILGEIIAQELEYRGLPVVRKLNLGGSFVCHHAMLAGDLDVYVEYTGTAYSAILELPQERDPQRVRAVVDSVYAAQWDLEWTEPLGFENTFAMLIRGETARRLGLTKMSEAVPHAAEWRGGFGYEFLGRQDGYPGLLDWYGLKLRGTPAGMEPGLMYRALADGTVDIVAGNSTDGQIAALDLFHLEDDLRYFPPYEAAPVVRGAAVERHELLREVLRDLGGTITADRMRRLNYLVDVERRDVWEVVGEFLDGLRKGWERTAAAGRREEGGGRSR